MSVTQRQLAEKLGVSQMAVSFALNDKPGVNQKTRRKILAAAEHAGYRPNASARATRRGKTRNIDLILGLHEAVSRIPTGLLEGVHDALAERELHLSISRLPDDKLTDEKYLPRVVREIAADGLLINYTHWFPEQLIDLIDRYNVPAVWLNAPLNQHCVRPDDELAGQMAAEHLLASGATKLSMYFVHEADHYSGAARQQGFMKAAREAGIKADVFTNSARRYSQIRHDVTTDERLALTRQWLDRPDRPDAVFAYSLPEASLLLLAAAQLGLNVPVDLSIITVADEIASYIGQPITTVVLPWREIAREAVKLVVCQTRGQAGEGSLIEVPPTFQMGTTTRSHSVSSSPQ